MFRKEDALKLKDSPFLQFRYCGDWLFWFQIAMQGGGIIEIYKKLNYFRQHNNKLTTTSRRLGGGFAEDIKVVHYMEQALPHLDKYKETATAWQCYTAKSNACPPDRKQKNSFSNCFPTNSMPTKLTTASNEEIKSSVCSYPP